MIAPWMGYVVVVTALLAAVAAMAERIATVQRWPRRWSWVGAIATLAVLVGLSPRRAAIRSIELARAFRVERQAAAGREAPGPGAPVAAATRRERGPLVLWGAVSEGLQTPLRVMWFTGSAALAVVFAFAAIGLARRRRTWCETTVDGVTVLVAPAEGPAVVGLRSPRVVIPEWSLSLDGTARGLMLRHELEHVRARDPLLAHAAALTLIALPWNLPLWWILRRLRLAVELDCDARVLARNGPPRTTPAPDARNYGELLLTVASRRSRRLVGAPALLEQTSALGRRIVAMHPPLPRFPRAHNAVFAAGAIVLTAVAGLRRPPVVFVLAGAGSTPGWVSAWQPDAHPTYTMPQVRERVQEQFPDLSTATGPTIVTLVRDAEGTVVRAFQGSRALGPVIERVAPGFGHPAELLRDAGAAGYHQADEAFFGPLARGDGIRANASAPVRDGMPASSIEVMRFAPGDVTPAVTYVFVITLTA